MNNYPKLAAIALAAMIAIPAAVGAAPLNIAGTPS